MTSGVVLFKNYDMTDTTSYFYLLYDYATTSDSQNFGLTLATLMKEFFNIQVPEVEYEDF
jgi:hypothetical protein